MTYNVFGGTFIRLYRHKVVTSEVLGGRSYHSQLYTCENLNVFSQTGMSSCKRTR